MAISRNVGATAGGVRRGDRGTIRFVLPVWLLGGRDRRRWEPQRRRGVHDVRLFADVVPAERNVLHGRARERDGAVRRGGIRAVISTGAGIRGSTAAVVAANRQPGPIQRLCPAGVRDRMVPSADRIVAQRRKPDTDGSAVGDGANQRRAAGNRKRHRDSSGTGESQYDGDRLVQHRQRWHAGRRIRPQLHRLGGESIGRSVWEHGVSERGGSEPDQQWDDAAPDPSAGARDGAGHLRRDRKCPGEHLHEQLGVGAVGRTATKRMAERGDRPGEFRGGGRGVRYTGCGSGFEWQFDARAAVPVQSDFEHTASGVGRGSRNTQWVGVVLDPKRGRATATASGGNDRRTAAGANRERQQHERDRRRMAGVRVWRQFVLRDLAQRQRAIDGAGVFAQHGRFT